MIAVDTYGAPWRRLDFAVGEDELSSRLTEFRTLAETVYGRSWVHRLSVDQDVGLRTVRRWASGAFGVPDDVLAALREMAGNPDMLAFRDAVQTGVDIALGVGLSPVVIHGALRDLAAQVLPSAPADPVYEADARDG